MTRTESKRKRRSTRVIARKVTRVFEAVGVAVRNGLSSFCDYYARGYDPYTRDALTLAYNRMTFERRRESMAAYSLLLIDIDNFKQINDHHGHSAGDIVLRGVAAALRISSGDRVFRVGGEEFAVLLRCGWQNAGSVAERLRQTVRDLPLLEGSPVTVSVGVAWTADDDVSIDHDLIYKRADAALYRAKGSGKDKVVLMDDERDALLLSAA